MHKQSIETKATHMVNTRTKWKDGIMLAFHANGLFRGGMAMNGVRNRSFLQAEQTSTKQLKHN